MKALTDREWEQFFTLLARITNRGAAVDEKRDEVIEKAKAQSEETALEEFVGWFDGTTEPEPV